MTRFCIVFFLLSATLAAQAPLPPLVPVPFPNGRIRQYLELTPEQYRRMEINMQGFREWQSEKLRRRAAVELELTGETARNPLDPMALGLRHMELETIRREIAERRATVMADARTLLNDAQKLKLAALEEALRLVNVAPDARALGLLPDEEAPAYLIRVPYPAGVILPGPQ